MQNQLSYFFFSYSSPFYYVRGATLLSLVAKQLGIDCSAIFKNNTIPNGSTIIFNRFSSGKFFSSVARWCNELSIPYVFDIDDAYWALPAHSQDDAALQKESISHADTLAKNASVIITTNQILAHEIQKRFPGQEVKVVGNCTSQGYMTKGGVCIANTDSFKVCNDQLVWFRKLLRQLVDNGVPVTLLGENDNFFENEEDFRMQISGRLDYESYLRFLSQGNFKFGLVPVEPSLYADCKSDIKIIEFLAANMCVYASNIAPYGNFVKENSSKIVHVVDHDESSWQTAVKHIIASYSKEELDTSREILAVQYQTKLQQFHAWLSVADFLKEKREKAAKNNSYQALMQKIKQYQYLQRKYHSVRDSWLVRNFKKIFG